jgi:hypothetical protein
MRAARLVLLLVALLIIAPAARASVSFTVVLDALVEESSAACVVTPVEAKSVWENGRIYTYTRVHVERTFAGSVAAGSEVWVQTMGGTVGDIGQLVDGEAVLLPGKTSLLFLKSAPTGYVVTARGQGQFPVVLNPSTHALTLVRNVHAGELLAPNPKTVARLRAARPGVAVAVMPAADVLDGKSLGDAATEVARAWSRTHAP